MSDNKVSVHNDFSVLGSDVRARNTSLSLSCVQTNALALLIALDKKRASMRQKQPTCVDCWAFSAREMYIQIYMIYSMLWSITQQLKLSLSSSLYSPSDRKLCLSLKQHIHSLLWCWVPFAMPRSLAGSTTTTRKHTTKASIIWLCK